jgi:hypothetical protein
MNVRILAVTLLISLAAGQQFVSIAQPIGRSKTRHVAPAADRPVTPLGMEIRRFLAEARQSSLDRMLPEMPRLAWFDDWELDESWTDDWEADRFAEEAADQPAEPSGMAVSIACVDGRYEIEAALADEHGWRKFRTIGTSDEIACWLVELPPRLRLAIERQLAELNRAADDH